MSQNAAMAALATWIGGAPAPDPAPEPGVRRYRGGPVPALGTVYTGFPSRLPGSDFLAGQPAGAVHGAVAVIRLEEPDEQRLTLGPHPLRRIAHPLLVHVYHRSTAKHSEDARAALRDLQDALSARLRSDTTLGGAVFSAGEADPTSGGKTSGNGHRWRVGMTESAGGRHETRSDWELTIIEIVSS